MARKTYKREVGCAVLVTAGLMSWRFWTLEDAAMVEAYANAWSFSVIGLVATGLAPFGIHHVFPNRSDNP